MTSPFTAPRKHAAGPSGQRHNAPKPGAFGFAEASTLPPIFGPSSGTKLFGGPAATKPQPSTTPFRFTPLPKVDSKPLTGKPIFGPPAVHSPKPKGQKPFTMFGAPLKPEPSPLTRSSIVASAPTSSAKAHPQSQVVQNVAPKMHEVSAANFDRGDTTLAVDNASTSRSFSFARPPTPAKTPVPETSDYHIPPYSGTLAIVPSPAPTKEEQPQAAPASTMSSTSKQVLSVLPSVGSGQSIAFKTPSTNPASQLQPTVVKDKAYRAHLELLGGGVKIDTTAELTTSPMFTESIRLYSVETSRGHTTTTKAEKGTLNNSNAPYSQYGLLAGDIGQPTADPRLFYNIAAPSSVFICGSQGSGKSHTLSCLLENCLIPSEANVLPRPLTGLIFHYDAFTSDIGGSPCEAAYLSTSSAVDVRVLCAPTNIGHIKRIYRKLPNVTIKPLMIEQSDLNTRRMLDLMAVSSVQGSLPLYLHVINRILRDMRLDQQNKNKSFNYADFKKKLVEASLSDGQKAPLQQRLETLESFMPKSQVPVGDISGRLMPPVKASHGASPHGTNWTAEAGELTIVDLSCPCVTAEMACSLFTICLSLFLEQDAGEVGRVVALDEAHKYMTDSVECQALTESLLHIIRMQRHQGARVFISTQEPTISPRLLDLCSITIVHRFTSPDWLEALKKHLAGASKWAAEEGAAHVAGELFNRIVALRAGEALLFAPSIITGVKRAGEESGLDTDELIRLGNSVLKVRVRMRITQDGGRSVMAG